MADRCGSMSSQNADQLDPTGEHADSPTRDAIDPTKPGARINRIGTYAFAGVCLLLLVMLGRVAQLQARPSEELKPFISTRVTTVKQVSVNGDLLDSRGRLCAGTRLGRRVCIDPVEFLKGPKDAINQLAGAMGMQPAEVAQRLAPRLQTTQDRLDAIADEDPSTTPDGKPIRYVSIGGVIEDWREESVKALKLPGVFMETRPVRAMTAGDDAAPLIGIVGVDHDGLLGAEKIVGGMIKPVAGKYAYVRDAFGNPMWVFPDGYTAPQRGEDVRISMDLELQRIAHEELMRGVEDADAAGGRCVIMDPRTGEIAAMVDIIREAPGVREYDWATIIPKGGSGVRYRTIRPDPKRADFPQVARNRCVEDVYEPGSTFKPFMWAATTDLGLARPNEIFNTYGGHWQTPYGRGLSDVTRRDTQTWSEVLINSSNIGMAQGTARMSFMQMRDAVVKFGFGRKTGIGLPGESPGIVTSAKAWSKYSQTSVAMGHEVAVTPIQMVRGFSAFARTGEMAGTLPPVNFLAVETERASMGVGGPRVLPRDIAELTRETMRGVTHNLDVRLGKKDAEASQFRYEAFGKSGTAEIPLGLAPAGKKRPKGSDGYYRGQYNSSFISGAPVDEPRLVVLVVIDDPGPERIRQKAHYGSAVAGPPNRRIMERALAYLAVPPTYRPGELEELLKADADGAQPVQEHQARPPMLNRRIVHAD